MYMSLGHHDVLNVGKYGIIERKASSLTSY